LTEQVISLFDRGLTNLLGERASIFRTNKVALFGLLGFCGGAIGQLLAVLAPKFLFASLLLTETIHTALQTAIAASLLTLALSVGNAYYLRKRDVPSDTVPKALLYGALAGAVAGGTAEAIYGAELGVEYWRELLLRPFCWGMMGALLGWRLSKVLPNLASLRALAGGALGGAIGGVGFLFAAILFPQFVGRMVGFGILGAVLGVAIVTIESLFRDAILEVHWAPNEVTTITLGDRPIYIGGGDDHVPVYNLPEHAMSISLDKGRIRYTDTATGRKTDLKDGSSIAIDRINLVIKAKRISSEASHEEY
jgi:hypothetical protein